MLDGIPESIVIGISLLAGTGVSLPVVAAVVLSNLPEAIASTYTLRGAGPSGGPRWSGGRILGVWGALALVFATAAALGYGVVGRLPGAAGAAVQAFAGGAVLTMLGDTMIPDAYEQAGKPAGLYLVFGFAVAFFLSGLAAGAG